MGVSPRRARTGTKTACEESNPDRVVRGDACCPLHQAAIVACEKPGPRRPLVRLERTEAGLQDRCQTHSGDSGSAAPPNFLGETAESPGYLTSRDDTTFCGADLVGSLSVARNSPDSIESLPPHQGCDHFREDEDKILICRTIL